MYDSHNDTGPIDPINVAQVAALRGRKKNPMVDSCRWSLWLRIIIADYYGYVVVVDYCGYFLTTMTMIDCYGSWLLWLLIIVVVDGFWWYHPPINKQSFGKTNENPIFDDIAPKCSKFAWLIHSFITWFLLQCHYFKCLIQETFTKTEHNKPTFCLILMCFLFLLVFSLGFYRF